MAAQVATAGAKPFRPRRLGHVNLFIGDLERSMNFYMQVVGLEESYRRPPIRAGFLSNGNTHHDIGMLEAGGPGGRDRRPGLNHLAFELENEVELVEGYRRALAAGRKFARTIDHRISRSVYCGDPDGNMNEIYADITKDWRIVRTGTVNEPTIQWTPGDPVPSPEPKYHANPEIHRVEQAVFHPVRVTHAVIVAADFEGAFSYYTELVGLDPVLGGPGDFFAILGGTCGGRDISLFRATKGRPAGLHHFGFEVGDEKDLEASVARLREAGLEPELQLEHATRRSVFVRDPDGFRIEFYVDRTAPVSSLSDLEEGVALYLA